MKTALYKQAYTICHYIAALSKPTINIENHLTVVLEGIYSKWLPEETFLWPPS